MTEPNGAAPPHPDDDELAAAQAEAAAATESAEPEQPAAEPAAEPAPEKTSDAPMIPKPRFDEVAQRGARAVAEAAYWKGRADAAQELLAKVGRPDAGDETPAQRIDAIEAEIDARAQAFDDGEISLAAFRRFERDADRRIAEIRDSGDARHAAPEKPASDMRFEELIEALPDRFPVLHQLDEARFKALEPMAAAELTAEGVHLGAGTRSTYLVHERMSLIAQQRYGGISPQPPTRTAAADSTKAARDKLALAGRAPPDLATVAAGKRDGDPLADARFASMDADDWAGLPDSVRHARLGMH